MAQPPQAPKYRQNGRIRSVLGIAMRSSARRSGWPGTASASTVSLASVYGTNTLPLLPETTPSPRWPTWSMTRRSATACADEEFDVAVAAGDGRWKYLDIAATQRSGEGRDIVADLPMHRRVADDSPFAMLSRRLELRLDQRQQMHRRRRQRQRHRQHQLERDEADIDHDDIGPHRQALAFEAADVGSFHRHDVGVVVQRGVQLAAPDVDGKHQA